MTNRILSFAIFGNEYQPHKSVSMQQLLVYLRQREANVYIDRPFFDFLSAGQRVDLCGCETLDNDDFGVDFAVSMGGDGTFLKAATRIGTKETPILGINTGRLGFLADVLPDEIEAAFDNIYSKSYKIEKRTAIEIEVEGENIDTMPYALNDIAVLKRDNASMISIDARINGEYLTVYQADGLIVSTPTGSTAYSLSNGGPVISPDTPTLCLTPVAPHSLTSRPMVISENDVVTLTVQSRSHNFLVAVDGRSTTLKEGTTVTIRRAPFRTNIVKYRHDSYFASLRKKMMWGADNRE